MCKREEDMSRFKLFAFIALITLAFAATLIGDALAGEKIEVSQHKAYDQDRGIQHRR